MKIYSLITASLLLSLNASNFPHQRSIDRHILSGNISLTLQHGLWKLSQDKPVYQDITLDLQCHYGKCDSQVWGYAPKFNKEVDHQGTVEVIQSDGAIELKVKMQIQSHPWDTNLKEAEYTIELVPYQNKLIGDYLGKYGNANNGGIRKVRGKVTGKISPQFPKKIPNSIPLAPQEHPRLIFRKSQLPQIQQKAKTKYGLIILDRLHKSLRGNIYYDGYGPNSGYHAAGYCFLSLLNEDAKAAETAWHIVAKTLDRPASRLLEQASIDAGIALAYDLCYNNWDREKRKQVTSWLASQTVKLVNGNSPAKGWNGASWSNWSARARSAAGLASLAILKEPDEFFAPHKYISQSSDVEQYLGVADRNIQRYLSIALGERGFGTEGDLYTRESIYAIIPFIQAQRNVLGKDLVEGSSAEWLLPHYAMRIVEKDGKSYASTYGRHRLAPDGSLFALGFNILPEKFLPAIAWFFDRHFGWSGDKSFGVEELLPHTAIYALTGYRDDVAKKNPGEVFGNTLVDERKGFYLFRDRWQDNNDFVASIYLKQELLGASWSFPDVGSFRIWGLGQEWAKAGESEVRKDSENVVVFEDEDDRSGELIFSETHPNGSGVVSLSYKNWLRSFAVDYSGKSGAPGLFVVVDRFTPQNKTTDYKVKTWTMHAEGKVKVKGQTFTIFSPSGSTLQGTVITPKKVTIEVKSFAAGNKIQIKGMNDFFVVMTVQKHNPPKVDILGKDLDAKITVGKQIIFYKGDRIILDK
jgi:hypothetical protein